ncbi:hypothetical protein EIP86_007212 [Pleurotus ostreatoroseus]|nr:hypothetical protein EIP86_007212 [Pleurotus ostreatoroseus]
MPRAEDFITGIELDSAGLVALADLSTIKQRTALMGSACVFDVLLLAPGIHTQQDATGVNGGELPQAGALTNGYVFRIENPATVNYLQKVGKTGHLVTVQVENQEKRTAVMRHLAHLYIGGFMPSLLYAMGITLTIASIVILAVFQDFWAMGVLLMLVAARTLNTIVVIRRSGVGWKGAREPGVYGDLLILLSQDRWIRMQGLVDDIKVVTAGHWLREQTSREGFASAFAMLLVYAGAALAINATTVGSLIVALLLLISAALLEVCNSTTRDMHVFGRRISVSQPAKYYDRRLGMVKDLACEVGRHDWAVKMDLASEESMQEMLKEVSTPHEKDASEIMSVPILPANALVQIA